MTERAPDPHTENCTCKRFGGYLIKLDRECPRKCDHERTWHERTLAALSGEQ